MEDRPTTPSATTALQGGNESHGNDSETQGMAIGPTTTLVTSTLQGGIQVGNNNKMIFRNCSITNCIINITQVTNKCKRCQPAEEHDVSEDTPRDLIPSSSVHTTTRKMVVDREGRELELGDVVAAEGDIIVAIYAGGYDGVVAGDGMVIGLDTKTRMIVRRSINVEKHFTSCSSQELSSTYSPMEIVERAKFIADQRSPDGPVDFVFWCCTDMTLEEWLVYKGVPATNPEMVHLRRLNASHSQTMPDKN